MRKHVTKFVDPLEPERRFDLRPDFLRSLARPALWGFGAVSAVMVAFLAAQTDFGARRLATLSGSITGATQTAALEQERRSAQRAREAETETRRLVETIREIAEDRDRLLTRMTAIERNYEDVTGSIGKLAGAPRPTADQLFPVGSGPDLIPIAPPPSAPATQPAAERAAPAAEAADTVSARSEFGVDLGGAGSVAALRTAWNTIRRNHASLLDGLRPVVGIRDGKNGQADLRLVVGPITNAASAAKLCATLAAAGLSCQPTLFDGQKLALR